MEGPIGWQEAAASLALVAVAIAISLWKRLGVERSIVWASLRAAVQLAAVGLVFGLIFESSLALTWAAVWSLLMIIVASEVVARRARAVPKLRLAALLSIGGSTVLSLVVVFGLGILPLEAVTLVVIAGITVGNTLPAAVLAADRAVGELSDKRTQVEGLLALGADRRFTARFMTPEIVRQSLIPQIERTKSVGLIALPGAMTGMLLAGADPLSSVLVQLVIMYLVLGAVAVGVSVVVTAVANQALTHDLRLAEWVRPEVGP